MSMTVAQYRELKAKAAKAPRVKGAKRTKSADGISHPSKLEAGRWGDLQLLERAGHISALERQVDIPLMGAHGPILTPTGRPAHYRADFTYCDRDGRKVIEDAKGMETEVFRLKRAILAASGITIKLTTRKGRK